MEKLEFKVTFIYGQNLRSLPARVHANTGKVVQLPSLHEWSCGLNRWKSSKPHQLYIGIKEIFNKTWEGEVGAIE